MFTRLGLPSDGQFGKQMTLLAKAPQTMTALCTTLDQAAVQDVRVSL